MPRPVIGVCAAIDRVRWGPWDRIAHFLPRSYTDAVQAGGGVALLLPADRPGAADDAGLLERLDALVLAGGSDVDPGSYGADRHPQTGRTWPERDGFELALARRALERDLPLLGICRGMQVLNLARGGMLVQHLPDELGHERHQPDPGAFTEHEVRLASGSLAARAAGAERITVKTPHHQGVAELGEGLVASGWSDPDAVIEAIELPGGGFALGVLWHPEEDEGDGVIPALVEAARRESG